MGALVERSADSPGTPAGATATTKLLPPAAPASLVRRSRLFALLNVALERRLTTVVGGAGYGKSTLLADWATDVHCAWYTASREDASLASFARGVADAIRLRVPGLPTDIAQAVTAAGGPGTEPDEPARARGFAAVICETLQTELRRDLVLVLDDVHEVNDSAGALQLIESLCRQAPTQLHLVLASRSDLPFPIERLRGQGQVLELASSDLAFDLDETLRLLQALGGTFGEATAADIQRATGGWPAAVRLAVEALRGRGPESRDAGLERIRKPGGPLFAYLAAEVFAHEPPEVQRLVRTVAPLGRFAAELCEALGVAHAGRILSSLARRGLFVELQGATVDWYTLGEPVREYALAHLDLDEAERRDIRLRAAQWFRERNHLDEALRCLTAAGDSSETARLLATDGSALLARGSVDAVLDAIASLEQELRDSAIEQLAGEAFFVRGSVGVDQLPAGLAWRMGVLLHFRGKLEEAIETYSRAGEEGDPRDLALLLAWRASAHWLRGEADECRADASRAFEIASNAGDARALAAAHTVLAMLAALEGDRGANDAHYLHALDFAQEAGDVLQLIRIRTNRGSRHLEEGTYEDAIVELDQALRLADLAGYASFRALALTNRGEAHARLSRFEEAVADLEDARELYQRLGSRMVAYPLEKLGEVYRARGNWALARAAYEEALAHAEQSGDLQALVPSLAGLARSVAIDEPQRAEELAERAIAFGPGIWHAPALLASGWIALAHGNRELARERAAEASAAGGVRRDRAALAEAIELRVLAAPDPARELARLEEARLIWRELRDQLGEARVELTAALLAGNSDAAAEAEERLHALGARGHRTTLSLLIPLESRTTIAVHSLGRFRVIREGQAVPLGAWQSRKARDLLKILVARRGRPTPREHLMEALWPRQSPERLGNRLSVLLSTVRAVLDPGKQHDAEHFVAADKGALWLQTENLAIDVERFLALAADALRLRRASGANAYARLVAAEAIYTGDFLEEDAYEDWAVGLREEARAAYTEVARALAEDSAASGDTDAATRFYLRVLERDPYDEPAHLGLVATLESAGRHGEARRCFRAYCARMDAIGVESAPFPGPALA
jgi:DNA-binding SARP family transcriptional activator/tetratricopeptide (TPR) repeat protein